MKKLITIFTMLSLIVGCSNVEEKESKEVIYTTIYPIEYALERLIGEKITIETIIEPGGDAHRFEPTQKIINEVAESDMFFFLGLGLEESADKLTSSIESSDVVVIEVGDKLDLDEEIGDHDHDEYNHSENNSNHHIWIDPIYMIDIVEVVKDELITNYPEHSDLINSNYEKLINDLIELDQTYATTLEETSKDTFIVSHDAFAHLEKYNITSVPVKDEAHSKDPTQKEINDIIDTANKNDISYVFYDQNIPCLPLDVIKSDISAEKMILHNLSVRTSDDISQDKDYIDLMLENLDNLVIALN